MCLAHHITIVLPTETYKHLQTQMLGRSLIKGEIVVKPLWRWECGVGEGRGRVGRRRGRGEMRGEEGRGNEEGWKIFLVLFSVLFIFLFVFLFLHILSLSFLLFSSSSCYNCCYVYLYIKYIHTQKHR